MRNRPGGAAPENAELAFLGGFAATDGTDFKLIRFSDVKLKDFSGEDFLKKISPPNPLS